MSPVKPMTRSVTHDTSYMNCGLHLPLMLLGLYSWPQRCFLNVDSLPRLGFCSRVCVHSLEDPSRTAGWCHTVTLEPLSVCIFLSVQMTRCYVANLLILLEMDVSKCSRLSYVLLICFCVLL